MGYKKLPPVQGSGVIRFVWSLCVRPSVRPSVCLSVRLSIRLSVRLSVKKCTST